MVATAPPADHWLLVEHTGPWGRRAIVDSGLDLDAAAGLARWTETHRARVGLIRRPGSARRPGRPRHWYLVDARPGREAVRRGRFTAERELLDVLADPGAGTPSTEPIFLVCAHGHHDTCCAIRGRPVAATLAGRFHEQTWECTHVGGDRFAANLVLLPHGLFYGQVAPSLAVDLVERYARREVLPELLRGRSSLPAPAQAAQHFARLETRDTSVDGLPVRSIRRLDAQTWTVLLDGGNGCAAEPVTVVVRSRIVAAGRPLTCTDTEPGRYRTFDLVDVTIGTAEPPATPS